METPDGVRVSVAAHDAFARAEYAKLRSAMFAAHPDKGGTPRKFIEARKRLDAFVKTDAAWYGTLGLQPPWSSSKKAK